MSLSKILALGFGFTLLTGVAAPAIAHSLKYVEDQLQEEERYAQLTNKEAPKFVLEDADGRKISLDAFKDKVVVLNFIYARCKEACPLHSAWIAHIQQQVNQTPMRDQVQFVSIATDTEDAKTTAGFMRSHAGKYELDPLNWVFLFRGGGPPDTTIRLAERYGLKFMPTGDGEQIHAVVTHVIDQNGMLRARYHGLKFNPTNLIVHLAALLQGDHEHSAKSGASARVGRAESFGWSMFGGLSWFEIASGLAGFSLMMLAAVAFYRISRR
ncbi:MAG: SCO family protein [Acidiferrobacterales bacterium]